MVPYEHLNTTNDVNEVIDWKNTPNSIKIKMARHIYLRLILRSPNLDQSLAITCIGDWAHSFRISLSLPRNFHTRKILIRKFYSSVCAYLLCNPLDSSYLFSFSHFTVVFTLIHAIFSMIHNFNLNKCPAANWFIENQKIEITCCYGSMHMN